MAADASRDHEQRAMKNRRGRQYPEESLLGAWPSRMDLATKDYTALAHTWLRSWTVQGHAGPQRRGQLAKEGGNMLREMDNVGSVTSILHAKCDVGFGGWGSPLKDCKL